MRDALQDAIPQLAQAGIDSARLDAELLLGHVLGVSRTWLAAHPDAELRDEQRTRLAEMLARRRQREPLPYLLGRWEFLGLSLRVTPAVLIPRPETELLVEEVARRLPPGASVLDVGTGSGCIALGLASLRPDVRAVGIDASATAIAVARQNARDTALGDRVTFRVALFPEALPELAGPFDAVVSNPPYIPERMADELPPEVRDHEPRPALLGGPDGLALLGPLLRRAGELLPFGGLLAVEVMAGQAETLRTLAEAAGGWDCAEIIPDLAGIPRVLMWRRVEIER